MIYNLWHIGELDAQKQYLIKKLYCTNLLCQLVIGQDIKKSNPILRKHHSQKCNTTRYSSDPLKHFFIWFFLGWQAKQIGLLFPSKVYSCTPKMHFKMQQYKYLKEKHFQSVKQKPKIGHKKWQTFVLFLEWPNSARKSKKLFLKFKSYQLTHLLSFASWLQQWIEWWTHIGPRSHLDPICQIIFRCFWSFVSWHVMQRLIAADATKVFF